jgi:hypothetical protein
MTETNEYLEKLENICKMLNGQKEDITIAMFSLLQEKRREMLNLLLLLIKLRGIKLECDQVNFSLIAEIMNEQLSINSYTQAFSFVFNDDSLCLVMHETIRNAMVRINHQIKESCSDMLKVKIEFQIIKNE